MPEIFEKMDFDIGTLIYILVTIVAVIAGVAGRKKKKVPAAQPIETGHEQDHDHPADKKKATKGNFFTKLEEQLESFAVEAKQAVADIREEPVVQEDELFAEEDEILYREDVQETDSQKNERVYESILRSESTAYEGIYIPDEYENDPLMEATGINVTDAIELIHLEEDHERSFDDLKDIQEFDARTAIIYSSIINRIEI